MSGSSTGSQRSKDSGAEDRVTGAEEREHIACCGIIMRIAELGPGLASPDSLPASIEEVRRRWRPAQRRELEGIMGGEDGYDTLEASAFIYAEQVPRGHPVLWPVMAFNAGRVSRNLKVRVALFYSAFDGSGKESPGAVGWRFEPPEDDTGSHSYYHAQPISSFDRSGRWRLPIEATINEVYPAFPLRAQSSVGLLAGMLVSLYGRVRARELLSDPGLRRDLRPVLTSLDPWL